MKLNFRWSDNCYFSFYFRCGGGGGILVGGGHSGGLMYM